MSGNSGPLTNLSARLNDGAPRIGIPATSSALQRGGNGNASMTPAGYYVGEETPAESAKFGASAKAASEKTRFAQDGPGEEVETEDGSGPDWLKEDDTRRKTRRYLIEMRFSMIGAAENPASVEWSVHQGMYYAFKTKAPGAAPGSTRTGSLERALLLGGAVHRASCTAPVVLLVQFAGMRGNRYTNAGLRAPFWVFPGQNDRFQPAEVIFKPDDNIYSAEVKNYSNLSEADITANIMRSPTEPYSYVPMNHCVTRLVRLNQEALALDLESMQTMDNRYKIHNKLVEKCQQTLRTQVFAAMPFTDFTAWKVCLARADGLQFDSPTNVEDLGENEEIQHELMEKENRVIIDLELTYYLCGDERPAEGAPAQA